MIARTLHALTHRIPGVPAHDADRHRRSATRRNSNSNSNSRHHGPVRRNQPPHGEPRVLVNWQLWISRHLARRG
jgi:hypothetical protein